MVLWEIVVLQAHLLFLDSPVGTGWSYTEGEEGYSTTMQVTNIIRSHGKGAFKYLLQECAIHLVEAVLQICELFPHFLPGSSATPPLVVFGEHTGGAAALAVAWQVVPAFSSLPS